MVSFRSIRLTFSPSLNSTPFTAAPQRSRSEDHGQSVRLRRREELRQLRQRGWVRGGALHCGLQSKVLSLCLLFRAHTAHQGRTDNLYRCRQQESRYFYTQCQVRRHVQKSIPLQGHYILLRVYPAWDRAGVDDPRVCFAVPSHTSVVRSMIQIFSLYFDSS